MYERNKLTSFKTKKKANIKGKKSKAKKQGMKSWNRISWEVYVYLKMFCVCLDAFCLNLTSDG